MFLSQPISLSVHYLLLRRYFCFSLFRLAAACHLQYAANGARTSFFSSSILPASLKFLFEIFHITRALYHFIIFTFYTPWYTPINAEGYLFIYLRIVSGAYYRFSFKIAFSHNFLSLSLCRLSRTARYCFISTQVLIARLSFHRLGELIFRRLPIMASSPFSDAIHISRRASRDSQLAHTQHSR